MAWSANRKENKEIQGFENWIENMGAKVYRKHKSDYINTEIHVRFWPTGAGFNQYLWDLWEKRVI